MRSLLGGIIASIALCVLPAQGEVLNTHIQALKDLNLSKQQRSNPSTGRPASTQRPRSTSSSTQVSDAQVTALVEALRRAAPKTGKANDGLYSEWQVTPQIIPSWSKQCVGRSLTPQEFEANAAAARQTVTCIARRELQKQYGAIGNNEPLAVRRVASWWFTGDAGAYNNGGTASYTQRVLNFYQQARANGSTQPTASPQQPNRSTTTSPSPSPSPSPSASPSPSPSASPSPSPSASPSPSPSPSGSPQG